MVRENREPSKIFFGKECLSVKLKEKDSKKSWHVDSGATSHMTISKEIFSEFDPSVKGHVLLAEENTTSEVKGMGSAVIKCIVDGQIREIPVQNVLYVPSLSSNLLSVKRLTKDGYSVNFQHDSCKVIKDGKVQAIARLEQNIQGLYKVETDVETASTAKRKIPGIERKHYQDPIRKSGLRQWMRKLILY